VLGQTYDLGIRGCREKETQNVFALFFFCMIISIVATIISRFFLMLARARRSRIDSRYKWHGGKYIIILRVFFFFPRFLPTEGLYSRLDYLETQVNGFVALGVFILKTYSFRTSGTATVASELSVFHFIRLKLCAEGEKRAWDLYKRFFRFVAFVNARAIRWRSKNVQQKCKLQNTNILYSIRSGRLNQHRNV
jgi:hypothetical protein